MFSVDQQDYQYAIDDGIFVIFGEGVHYRMEQSDFGVVPKIWKFAPLFLFFAQGQTISVKHIQAILALFWVPFVRM